MLGSGPLSDIGSLQDLQKFKFFMPELLLKEYDLYLGDERFVSLHIALVYLLQQLNPISTHLLETVVVVVKALQFFAIIILSK